MSRPKTLEIMLHAMILPMIHENVHINITRSSYVFFLPRDNDENESS